MEGNGTATAAWTLVFGEKPPEPKTSRGTKVVLGDGQEWLLPPLSFHDRKLHPEVLERVLHDFNWQVRESAREDMAALVGVALRRNYPGITDADVLVRLDLEAACACFKVLWVQEGAQFQDLLRHLGLAPPSNPNPPTGTASTDG